MELDSLDSIVLKRIKFGDTSLIATLFTRDRGKIGIIAKGARAAKSKRGLASALEPLNRIEAVVYFKSSRSLQILSSGDIIDDASAVKSDYDKLTAGMSVVSVVDRYVVESVPSIAVWNLLNRALQRLGECEPHEAISVALQFKAAMLVASGFAPTVERCALCGGNIDSSRAIFSVSEGGILCMDCAHSGAIELDGAEVALVQAVFGDQTMRIVIPNEKIGKLSTIIADHEKYHMG